MPVESDADRASFGSPDEFGTIAQYKVKGSETEFPVSGIFDDDYLSLGASENVGHEGSSPVFEMRQLDLPAGSSSDDKLVVAGISYRIVESMPDGTGMIVLRLSKT